LPELPENLSILHCAGNNLPYEDLDGYKFWYSKTPQGMAKKFNI